MLATAFRASSPEREKLTPAPGSRNTTEPNDWPTGGRVSFRESLGALPGTLLIVLVLNALFLAFALAAATLPAEKLRGRTLEAFEAGSVSTADYLPRDRRIGWHQYNDCLILQMISNPDAVVHKALGPLLYHQDDYLSCCLTTQKVLSSAEIPGDLESYRYTRFWHGNNALTAVLLYVLDLGTIRQLFSVLVYLSLAALAMSVLSSTGPLRLLGLSVVVFSALFWSLPYFSQSPSHGPGDAAVLAGLASLFFLSRRGIGTRTFIWLCTGFGAVLVFLEFFTGLLPTAGAILLPLGYFAAGRGGHAAASIRERWFFAISGLVGFGVGAFLTILIKQGLAFMAFGPEIIDAFVGNLNYYRQGGPGQHLGNALLSGAYVAAAMIGKSGKLLTYWNTPAALILFSVSALAWIAAGVLAIRNRSKEAWSALAVTAAGALVVYAWILLVPTHSYGHPFMVRMMVAPLALGWFALALQARRLAR
jgi:hypothetical protein